MHIENALNGRYNLINMYIVSKHIYNSKCALLMVVTKIYLTIKMYCLNFN